MLRRCCPLIQGPSGQFAGISLRIDRLSVDDKEAVFWDRDLPGFGVQVCPTLRGRFGVPARGSGIAEEVMPEIFDRIDTGEFALVDDTMVGSFSLDALRVSLGVLRSLEGIEIRQFSPGFPAQIEKWSEFERFLIEKHPQNAARRLFRQRGLDFLGCRFGSAIGPLHLDMANMPVALRDKVITGPVHFGVLISRSSNHPSPMTA